MEFYEQMEKVNSKEDLADFVDALLSDLMKNADKWENPSLEGFLEAMSAWVRSMDASYQRMGKSVDPPTWSTFANILYASKIYE